MWVPEEFAVVFLNSTYMIYKACQQDFPKVLSLFASLKLKVKAPLLLQNSSKTSPKHVFREARPPVDEELELLVKMGQPGYISKISGL